MLRGTEAGVEHQRPHRQLDSAPRFEPIPKLVLLEYTSESGAALLFDSYNQTLPGFKFASIADGSTFDMKGTTILTPPSWAPTEFDATSPDAHCHHLEPRCFDTDEFVRL